MCYDISFLTRRIAKYANRLSNDTGQRSSLEQKFGVLQGQTGPQYHAAGYDHPYIPVMTNEFPLTPQLYQWGLIPFWAKDAETAGNIRNKTINARGEQIFERASYKAPAKYRRCVVVVDGFFEHHHFKQKKYPFYIHAPEEEPLLLAGLWDRWEHPQTGNLLYTVSIVTTKATGIMQTVHNNPKLKEPRMPLILDDERMNLWLSEEVPRQSGWLKNILTPQELPELKAYPVPKIRGKAAAGNTPQARKLYEYPELPQFWQEISN